MPDHHAQAEPTRPLPAAQPDCDGNFRATAHLSSVECKTRALLRIPSLKVIPVIVIPGIMGSNLCATTDPTKPANKALKPGEAAWRPPNGSMEGLSAAKVWKKRQPPERQQILDPDTLDVDGTGPLAGTPDVEVPFDAAVLKERGWGQVHFSSYGWLLAELELQLNSVFSSVWGIPRVQESWLYLGKRDRSLWGAGNEGGATAKLTDKELMKFAQFHYPVYALGYNWLQSNELSAQRLEKRIEEVIKFWTDRRQQCTQVILVTHSMGGLVARACAKRIPDKILGVVHGVMPALGAPVCYRRIACGTEASSPNNSGIGNIAAGKFADIAGRTEADTTAIMATAAGPLELLPNNQYPKPWLFASVENGEEKSLAQLNPPNGNVYDLYRDTTSWYRMIDPALADPADKFADATEVAGRIKKAIDQAERFHTTVLGNYYHPNSYAFYGADPEHLSFASCRWRAAKGAALPDPAVLAAGTVVGRDVEDGGRSVKFSNGATIHFTHSVQDGPGDGTVPQQSGVGPAKGVKQIFRTKGYDHQGSYHDESMLALTMQLIARIALDAQ
jgi:pimeloyl-ACP methyl ester carboxylesterase